MSKTDEELASWREVISRDDLESFYESVIPNLKKVGRELGYAIAIHGSLRRDLDIIAVPWVDKVADKDKLAEKLMFSACGFKMSKYTWEIKPNGRMATSFPICTIDHTVFGPIVPNLCHIDLSVCSQDSESEIRRERDREILAMLRNGPSGMSLEYDDGIIDSEVFEIVSNWLESEIQKSEGK